MLNKRNPEDFVISTGRQYSVRDFTKLAFRHVGLDYKKFVEIDKKLQRPSEVDTLLGNCNKAKKKCKMPERVRLWRLTASCNANC